ncbi:MAG: DUF3857 domain-containing transglutaminase family protein [Povalibacter sp.]
MSNHSHGLSLVSTVVWLTLLHVNPTNAADVPDWLRAQASATLPAYDEKTNAVVLYDDTVVTVMPDGKIRSLQRRAMRILRPGGESWGVVRANFDDRNRILHLRAWCLPVDGKPFVVKEKEAIETSLYGVDNGELISDLRTRVLSIPAATPGSVIGYELEQEEQPYLLLPDQWDFQETVPVHIARYTLQLPAGWSYRASWLNHPAAEPVTVGPGQWQWSLSDLPAVPIEFAMPPWQKIAGRLSLSLVKPGEAAAQALTWSDVGAWYTDLTRGRTNASPEMKQKAAELVSTKNSQLEKMNALARFVQNEIRYVAIELGIGGHQPHAAAEVFVHRYGDCKDKVTLLAGLLHEIGIESYYVLINTERGAVDENTAPNLGFNHAILAIALPENMNDPSLLAVAQRPNAGRILFFDPTDAYTPLGRIRGELQANYGLLVTGSAGELMALPQLSSASSYVQRTAHLRLSTEGDLTGDLQDVRLGDPAARARAGLRSSLETDRIRPVERLLADSLSSFQLTQASVLNLTMMELPFEWRYTFEAPRYAKRNGEFLLLRPWVLGSRSSSLLETREARQHPIEFDGPGQYRDSFEISLPEGYDVEDLPDATSLDIGVATYESKTELVGRTIRYSRILEIKQLSVPASNADQLKKFYRNIYGDERRVVALKQRVH